MIGLSAGIGIFQNTDPMRCCRIIAQGIHHSLTSISADPYPSLTFVGAVIATAKTAILFFRKNGHVGITDVIVVFVSWASYKCAKNRATANAVGKATQVMQKQVRQLQSQLDQEKKLTQTQRGQIEQLRKASDALKERAQELEAAAKSHSVANQNHASLLRDSQGLLEEQKREASRIEGRLEAYRQELREIEEEFEASEKHKRSVKGEITTLLEEQRKAAADLAEKIEELRRIEKRLNQKQP